MDVENVSVIYGTLNFTFAGSRLVQPSEKVHKFCGQVWMEERQSMEGSELQCKINQLIHDPYPYIIYNCSSNSGMVCRKNADTNGGLLNATTSCSVPNEGGSKVLEFVFTHN